MTYPDRGLGDSQISAEYVVHALRRIRAESGRKVAVIGHSQGVSVLAGEAFGPSAAGHIRLGLVLGNAALVDACQRITRCADELKREYGHA